ncbi:TAXI family TRAP transporter solute-binding subunit [Nisaea acidiphila]|uniref:TAXI family TRAP transporter solute-binding subunit n=1 Tax=Nisaea acidiphila TaxID=1862145 RepID=A0A9J7AP99_9PROT|nr:TAXI family TRAP transporter solute-binding subunit [Nisaea acidiphila]UUX48172.1 TAXI family TRAP transporter solute-binding subunit [Nisaea acidiphila]
MPHLTRPHLTLLAMVQAVVLAGNMAFAAGTAAAQDKMIFFQIATGGVDGTYYPLGTAIANAISRPPGSPECAEGSICGVENLVAAAQSSSGSVDNVAAVDSGRMSSGFAQADIVYAAYFGTGPFDGQPPMKNIRALAHLYPEVLHVLVRRDAGIETINDMVGKRVSIDEPGSGLLVMVRDIFEAYGIDENQMIASYLKPGPAVDMLVRDELDALFQISGMPSELVEVTAEDNDVDLLTLDGPKVNALLDKHRFLSRYIIPADTYESVGEVTTLSVGSQWIVPESMPEQLVYDICRALWNEATLEALATAHPQGRNVKPDSALDGIAIPLHSGAERCYRDLGILH